MTENESRLIRNLEEQHADYYNLLKSDEYALGKKLLKLPMMKKIIRWLRREKLPATVKYTEGMRVEESDYSNLEGKKIVVYTCVTGGYDERVEPLFCNSEVDYVFLTDNKKVSSKKWQVKIVDNPERLDAAKLNRYYKMHPWEVFKDYDYAIYVDGNLKIVSDLSSFVNKVNEKYGFALSLHSRREKLTDELKACKMTKRGNYKKLKEQVERYLNEGYPDNYGMLEAPVIVFNLKNEFMKKVMNEWWEEFLRADSGRDQFSLPYVLWKNGVKVKEVGTISKDIFMNAKIEKGGKH